MPLPFPFERFVARRYLFGAEGRTEGRAFLRFIVYVAVGGVAVGVAALLLALSIVRGFSEEIEAKIVGFGAHVQVESYRDAPLGEAEAKARALAALPLVRHVAPVVTEFALLRHRHSEIDGVALWGTDRPPPFLQERLTEGAFTFAPDRAGRPGAVLGEQLARRLGVAVGDRVTAFSMRRSGEEDDGEGGGGLTSALAQPRVKQFHVTGLYETSLADFDDLYVFTDVEAARQLLDYGPDEVTRFDLTLADPAQAEAVAADVEERLGFPVLARSIREVFRNLFAWVNLQESIIPLVIGVIVLVAAFNILSALLMMILEKAREIGVMGSMGASAKAIRRLFLWLGLLIGLLGTGIGEGLALGLALLQQRYGIIPLPEEAYYMKTAPVALSPLDFLVVAAIALALCALSAYIPARVAARIEPARVIRFR